MTNTLELWANNARTTIAGSLSNIATSIVLQSGAGALFPSPNNGLGQFAKATLQDAATGLRNEIVYITARTGDVLTVVRGQDGTTAQTWSAGDTVFEGVTAATLAGFVQPAQLQSGIYLYAIAAGTANALTASFTPAIAAYTDGMILTVKAAAANTSPTVTINVNGVGVVPIVKGLNVPLAINDIIGANHFLELVYSSTYSAFVISNPATSSNGGQSTLLQLTTTNLYIKPNATTPNTKLDITAQEAMLVSGYNVIKPTSISVTLDMTVNGANGLDTGTRAINTWYTLYLIGNGTTVAVLASLSTSAPTLPSGYIFGAFIGALRINASSNIVHFTQRQNVVEFTETSVLTAGQAVTNGVFQGLSIATAVPAQAKRAKCRLSSSIAGNGVLKVAANASGDGVAGGNVSTANLYETVQVLIADQQLLYWTQNSNTAGAVCIINISGFEY